MNRILVTAIVLFVAFLLVVYFVLPKRAELNNLKERISNKELLFREKGIYLSTLRKNLQKMETSLITLDKVDAALPQEMSLASVLNFFQEKTSENGLVLEDINQVGAPGARVREKVEEARIKEHYFSLHARSSFPAFGNFLRSLETSARLFEVEGVSLNSSETGILEASILVKVHSY